MRLMPRVYLVGSGAGGFSLTDRLDCHVYLLDGGEELALIDGGAGRAPEQIIARIVAAGFSPSRVRSLLLTHQHADHAGGAAAMRELCGTGLRVVASAHAAHLVAAADEEGLGLRAARAAQIYPQDYRFAPCAVDRIVRQGDVFAVGDLQVRVLETPGHCRGHLSYLIEVPDGEEQGSGTARRRVLFAGDALFANGRIQLQYLPDCSVWESGQTIEKLDALALDCLFPGHGAVVCGEAAAHVAQARATLHRLLPPPNLIS